MHKFHGKLGKKTKSNIELGLQATQTIVSLIGLGVVLYGLFFSNLSTLVEAQLRSTLATAQYDNLQLKKQKDALNSELTNARATLHRELAAVAEIKHKKEALELAQWQRVVAVFSKGIRAKISSYRSTNKKPQQILSDIDWIRNNAKALALGDPKEHSLREGKHSVYLKAALINYAWNNHFNEIARATARTDSYTPGKVDAEQFLEQALRRSLFTPLANPVTGKPIFLPIPTGNSTIDRMLHDHNISYLSEEAATQFRDIVSKFLAKNEFELNQPLEFRMSSIDETPKEILIQASSVSKNIDDFESLMTQLQHALLESKSN